MTTTTKILFVGEQRSATAIARGWSWRDGRLAAKTLFDALATIAVAGADQQYVNLWADDVDMVLETVSPGRRAMLRREARAGRVIVALGARVAAGLRDLGIAHVPLTHPAARGWIRGRARYAAHVAATLGPALAVSP